MCVHKLCNLPNFDMDWSNDNCSYECLNNQIKCDSSDLSIIQLNIRGLYSKLGDLDYLLNSSLANKHPDVVLLCETWLTPRSPKPYLSGYDIERSDRLHKKGGGVGILMSARCKYKRRHDLEQRNCNSFESCFVEIHNLNTKIILGSVYRPPNTDVKEFISATQDIIETCNKQGKKLVLGLDHNLDFLKEVQHSLTHTFLETIYDGGLVPMITKPTRITTTTATLIDNILVDQQLQSCASSGILIDTISDHLPCYTILSDIYPIRKKNLEITSRDMRRQNLLALKTKLIEPDYLLPTPSLDVDAQFDEIHGKLLAAIDHFLPERTRSIPSRSVRQQDWMTPGLMISIKKNKMLYKKWIRTKTDVTHKAYTTYNSKLQWIKRKAKQEYYMESCRAHKHNMRNLWRTINKIIHKSHNKTEVIEKLKINNIEEHHRELIAEEFASYFSGVGKKFAEQMPTPQKNLREHMKNIVMEQSSIFMTPVTKSEVERHLKNLKPKNSSGLDNINNKLLKELVDCISEPLAMIFNNSISNGIFPTNMKTAKVIPLHKSKSKSETTNYRPISLLITISKILEKVVYKRVYNFLCDTKQLYISQYGFRKNHSCEHAIGELVANITKGIEQGKLTASVFLDLSKAFDSLEHSTIFKKMDLYGIRGCCLDWFKSYLQGRSLRVSCKTADTGCETISSTYDVEYGTPQGSVLGPLIFLIFCNDLQKHLLFLSCIQFADDTTLYVTHHNLNYIKFCLTHDLAVLQDWFLANKLTLNIGKSVCILFGKHRNQKLNLSIGEAKIPQTKSTKVS